MQHKNILKRKDAEVKRSNPAPTLALWVFVWLLGLTFFYCAQNAMAADNSATSIRKRIKIKKNSYIRPAAVEESENLTLEKLELKAKLRKRAIDEMGRFLREAREGAQKAELNRRLAAAYMEDYYQSLARAQKVFELKMDEYTKIPEAERKSKRPPQVDNSEAKASLSKARAIYTDLIRAYPKHPELDEAHYFLAATSINLGKVKQAMGHFKRLSDKYPKSKYVDDALIELADYYFEANKFPAAESYYNKIIKKGVRKLLPYANYKKAWCKYNRDQKQEALDLFKWVAENEEGIQPDLSVKKEVYRDITLPFTDLKLLNESVSFFEKVGEPHERSAYEIMAALYLEKANYNNSRTLWERLLKMDPNHKKNPEYDIDIIESYTTQGKQSDAIKRLFSRLPNYLSNSNWYELNRSDTQTLGKARESFEATARKYAYQIHAQAQKTKDKSLYTTAKALYAKYLEYFSNTTDAPKIQFYLAEILYKQNEFIDAAKNYWAVYRNPQAGKMRLDSIRYALNSLDKQISADRKKLGLKAISTKNATKLNDDEKNEKAPYTMVEETFIKVAKEYLKNFSNTKDAPDILFTMSYLEYSHKDFQPAYTNFWIFMKKFPKHAARYDTANLILDILNREKDYAKLVAACKMFMRTNTLSKANFRATVGDVLRKAELKRIAIIESQGKHKLAGLAYVEYTKAYGAQDIALFETALYNASINFTKAEMWLKAVETQEHFLRRFKKSKLREDMLLQVATMYDKMANFNKAAYYYEEFAENYPRNKQAASALRLSGVYYSGAGKTEKAEQIMQQFTRIYPNSEARAQVEDDLMDIYRSNGDVRKRIALMLDQRSRKGVPFSTYLELSVKIAELQAKTNSNAARRTASEALNVANKYESAIKKSANGREALARLYFWSLRNQEEQFYSLALRLPQAQLERNLQKKLALLNSLENSYSKIISIGSRDWSMASVYQTASIYRHMAETVLQAPVPSELSAEQLEMYRNELEKSMIAPFNEKALSYAVQCLDKAQELNLLNNWTPRCYSLASELESKRYPNVRTFYLPSLTTALLLPNPKESKVEVGKVLDYPYPLYSSGMFDQQTLSRTVASANPLETPYYNSSSSSISSAPVGMTYRTLSASRKQILAKDEKKLRPSAKKDPSFAYLNIYRLMKPKEAVAKILSALETDPNNEALHNLLGLTYLEMGELNAARVTYLALTARGHYSAHVWNNLGVIANLLGDELQAIDLFRQATKYPQAGQAHVNLAFIALKYHNGFEAKVHFKRAVELDIKDPTVLVGYSVARLQNRELDDVKQSLADLTRKYRNDPYAYLSTAYLLIDIAKENQLAEGLLKSFMEKHSAENDPMFRAAVMEARQGAGNSLPQLGSP